MSQPNFIQNHFRYRNDNGSESTATWIAATDANPASLLCDRNYRMRLAVQNTSPSNGLTPTLYYSKNAGSYTRVNLSSSVVRSRSSISVADGTPTTQQISSGGYIANVVDTADGAGIFVTLLQNYTLEVEFCFQIRSVDVAHGDVIQLRVYNSTLPLYSYTVVPSITVNKSSFHPWFAHKTVLLGGGGS
jgi:hypothetical protein